MSARHLAGVSALAAALVAASPAHAGGCEPKDLAALAGWGGVWLAEGQEVGISGRREGASFRLVGDAPWNLNGWGRLRGMTKLFNASPSGRLHRADGGWAFPMMMEGPDELKFLIAPGETAIVSSYRDIRYVYTDGRQHPPKDELWATNWGDSVGCWEGDTLVIDTVGVRYDPDYMIYAPPLSDQAHFVERLRLAAPGRIEGTITITDPETLTGPYTVKLAWTRETGIDRLIHDGTANDRSVAEGGSGTIAPPHATIFAPEPLPPEIKLSAAQLDRLTGRYALEGTPLELRFERQGDRLYLQPPGSSISIPLLAVEPLSFEGVDGSKVRFIADASGRVTGLEGVPPSGGAPGRATRKQP